MYLTTYKIAFTQAFYGIVSSNFLAIYSKRALSIEVMAISIAPKAREPKWNLRAHLKPVLILTAFLA